jgi:hypothetical protein
MKGIGLLIFGAVALLTGITLAVMFIRKRRQDGLLDFDDFDTAVSDEEFEHFFGSEPDEDIDED